MHNAEQVSLQTIAEVTGRSANFVRFAASVKSITIQDDCKVDLLSALNLTKELCIKPTNQDDQLETLELECQQLRRENTALDLAKQSLEEKLSILEHVISKSEARSDNVESFLMHMTKAMAQLADNRDNIITNMVKMSSYRLEVQNHREVLVLENPVSDPRQRTLQID